jgi:hypothetical protein
MREEILRRYFEEKLPASELLKDLETSKEAISATVSEIQIEDMENTFPVLPGMLIRLCDDVLNGHLPAWCLEIIGFVLMASDRFEWDGDEYEVMANVIADWSCPQINFPLTTENVRRFKEWLAGTEAYPEKPQSTGSAHRESTLRLASLRIKRT